MTEALALVVACSGPQLSGALVDASGRPVAGAKVRLGERATATGGDGRFELSAVSGPARWRAEAEGFLPREGEVALGGAVDLGRQVMVRIPEDPGVYVLVGERYVVPPASSLRRREAAGPPPERRYCVDPSAPAADVPPGRVELFERAAPSAAVFALDPGGCALGAAFEDGEWVPTFGERADGGRASLAYDQARVVLEGPGDWFVAAWRDGWVAEISQAGEVVVPGFRVRTSTPGPSGAMEEP